MSEHEHCHHDHHSHEGIEIKRHEEALVITISREVPKELVEVKFICRECIENFCGWIEDNEGIVGHIKGYMHSFEKGYTFSCTGEEVTFYETKSNTVLVKVVAILYGVKEEGLACKVAEIFEGL